MAALRDIAEGGSVRAAVVRLLQPDLVAGLLALGFALAGLLALVTRAVDVSVYRADDVWLVILVLAPGRVPVA